MNSIIELLSGEVPGGFLLLLLLLFIINLSLFFFFRGSKFFTKEEYKRRVIKSTLFLLVSYVALWIILKPVPIPESILIIPFQNGKVSDYKISEILDQQIEGKLSDDYRLHNWEWFYETCNKDSIDNFDYRVSVANRLNINNIITGQYLNDSKINVLLKSENLNLNKDFEFESYADLAINISSWINKNLSILNETELTKLQVSDDYLSKVTKAKLLYLNSKNILALNITSKMDSIPVLLISKIYLELGIKELKNSKKSKFENNENKYFAKILNLLIPIAQEGHDNYILNRILGRLYLYEEKYKEAEIFLKKGLTQNPFNARIYNDFYYLHQDRFKDLGFDDRFEVLKKAIELDHGYSDAVYNLANDYFQTGTGIKSGKGTTYALETLNRFMKINSENKKILALLANIKLQIKHAEEATEIYKKLIELGDNESETYYNLGISYFHQKKYDEAKKSFLKSISINEYPDSYLYMGAINKILGNYDKALYYYRERIKRSKKGEDDYYAKEALHGLQWILKRQYEDSSESKL
jgi:tetratricopeptide (TPR) repeat protein